jgi:hypothetical protein
MHAEAGKPVAAPSAWTGSELRGSGSWIYKFSETEIDELDAALQAVDAMGLDAPAITKEHFPLPTLRNTLSELAQEVEEGRGFQVVRGIPVERYDYDQLRQLFWGIGLYFATPWLQTKDGDWFIDVRDEGKNYDENMRGYHSTSELRYHSDGTNMVALLCIQKARQGGESSIVSSAAIYNRMLEERPDLLDVLYKGYPHDRRGAQPDGAPRLAPWNLPVFSFVNGRFICVYDRKPSEWGREMAGAPFSETDHAAFDFADALTHDEDFRLDMAFEPGDIQFLNNFLILHSRKEFIDDPDPAKQRHLLRLWFDNPKSQRRAVNKIHLYTDTPLPDGIPIQPSV